MSCGIKYVVIFLNFTYKRPPSSNLSIFLLLMSFLVNNTLKNPTKHQFQSTMDLISFYNINNEIMTSGFLSIFFIHVYLFLLSIKIIINLYLTKAIEFCCQLDRILRLHACSYWFPNFWYFYIIITSARIYHFHIRLVKSMSKGKLWLIMNSFLILHQFFFKQAYSPAKKNDKNNRRAFFNCGIRRIQNIVTSESNLSRMFESPTGWKIRLSSGG